MAVSEEESIKIVDERRKKAETAYYISFPQPLM